MKTQGKRTCNGCNLPSSTMLTNLVSASSKLGSPPPVALAIMSFRCWGHSPSKPPAEPHGKVRMALATSSSDTWIDDTLGGAAGKLELGWGAGCLSQSDASASSLRSAIESSEEANLTAPLKSPSSSLADI